MSLLMYHIEDQNTKVKLTLKSSLFDYSESNVVSRSNWRAYLHRCNAKIIQKYLLGYAKSRVIAFEKMGCHVHDTVPKLNNFIHYLSLKNPADYRGIYTLILRWQELLIASLPADENVSHIKVNAAIKSCEVQLNKLQHGQRRSLQGDSASMQRESMVQHKKEVG